MAGQKTLFSARTTDGISSEAVFDYKNGKALVTASGSFDGASIAIQYSVNGGSNYHNIPGGTLDVSVPSAIINATNGELIRAVQSGSGATTSLSVAMHKIAGA